MWRTASILVGIVLLLVTLGIVILASSSAIQGETVHRDASYFLKRQVMALFAGFLAAVLVARMDYRWWRNFTIPLALLAIALLVMAVTPGVGISVNGSSRWLRVGNVINIQPSEFGKFAAILVLSWWMSRVQRSADGFHRGLVVPILFLGGLLGLIFIEPDFGTTMLTGCIGMAIMFVGGTRLMYLVSAGALGAAAMIYAIMRDEERMDRILAFLNPEAHAQDAAFQLLNAIYAFVVGGGAGVGLGASLQKRFYLPEAHTDFIFAILGEELGLAASLGVVFLFLGFLICGLRISMRAPDMFGRLLAFGITSMITLQAALNIGVVTGCLPTKGLPLPFISFGGTSLAMSLIMVGVLVNIALHAGAENPASNLHAVKDRVHHF